MGQYHDYDDRKFDASVYDEAYFIGGQKSGYGDYSGVQGMVRDQYRMINDVMVPRAADRTKQSTKSLDAACAYGYGVAELQAHGWQAYGFDISAHAILKAKQLNGPNFYLADALDDSFYDQFGNKEFGLVTGVEFFEHIESKDVPRILQNFARIANWGCFVINGRTAPDQPLDSIHGDHGHLNNHLMSWWIGEFAKVGDLDFDAMGELSRQFENYNKSVHWHNRVMVVRFN